MHFPVAHHNQSANQYGYPVQRNSSAGSLTQKAKPEKKFGEPTDCYVAVLQPNEPIKEFLMKVGTGCKAIERFVHKNRVYFTGDVSPDMMMKLSIKRRMAFKPELRESKVLILTIKDKQSLTLDEACDIVRSSELGYMMDRIELVAVNPKTKKKVVGSVGMVHAYVQFLTTEDAKACVNAVDALYYKGYYVHSPQLDEHEVFLPSDHPSDTQHVWRNDATYAHTPESTDLPLSDSPSSYPTSTHSPSAASLTSMVDLPSVAEEYLIRDELDQATYHRLDMRTDIAVHTEYSLEAQAGFFS
eukprot:TRINITY_DN14951_c0_g1_i1.p1 TRINITY_DN14951_c0_g1~~TRINITY_DN14951_c0_g1_i1.p1  ORF type:complete len:336 (+),score=126.81 TRINITY_DN14951_c0_g1_i1:111-1010(+)